MTFTWPRWVWSGCLDSAVHLIGPCPNPTEWGDWNAPVKRPQVLVSSDLVGSTGGLSREFSIHMSYVLLCISVNPHLVHMLLAVGSIACYFKSARFDFQRRKKRSYFPFSAPFSVSRGTIQGRHPRAPSDATNSCLHLKHPTGYPGVTHCQNKEGQKWYPE